MGDGSEGGAAGAAAATFRYRAFISYRHADRRWGDWLHRALESYRVPAALAGAEGECGPVPAHLRPVFRDREELAASPNLGEKIEQALRDSANLVVICSPRAAASPWVNAEVLFFKRLGREGRIFPIIVDGEPHAGDPALECFPPALRFQLGADGALTNEPAEPLAADARERADGRDNALLKLAAGLLGVDYDRLRRREAEAQRRRFRRFAAAASVLVLVFAALAGAAALLGYRSSVHLGEANAQLRAAKAARSAHLAEVARAANEAGNYESAGRYALAGMIGADDPDTGFDATRAELELLRANLENRRAFRLTPNDGPLTSAAISPDGSLALTGGATGAHLWDMKTGEARGILRTGAPVRDARFSPDGARIATASSDGTAALWDAATGARLADLKGCEGVAIETPRVGFDAAGRRVSLGARVACVWDAATGALLLRRPDSGNFGVEAILSPDGDRVAVATYVDTRIFGLGPQGGELAIAACCDQITDLRFSPDGRRLLTASTVASSGKADLWDVASGAKLLSLGGQSNPVTTAEFSARGDSILTGSSLGTVAEWDIDSGEQIALMRGHDGAVLQVASVGGGFSLSAANDGVARVWLPGSSRQYAALIGHRGGALRAAFSPDGSRVLTASADGTARIWRTDGAGAATPLDGGEDIYSLAQSPDGRRLAALALDGAVIDLIDAGTGARLSRLSLLGTKGVSLAWLPDGQFFLVGGADGDAYFVDSKTGAEIRHFPVSNEGTRVIPSPDGRLLLAANINTSPEVWDIAEGRRLAVLAHERSGEMSAFPAFDPSGRRVALGMLDGTVTIYDARSGAPASSFRAFDDTIQTLAFTTDGTGLLVTSFAPEIRLFAADTGAIRMRYVGHTGPLSGAVLSPDSTLLLSAASDGSSRLWDVASGLEIMRFHDRDSDDYTALFSPDGGALYLQSISGHARRVDLAPVRIRKNALIAQTCQGLLADGISVFESEELAATPIIDPTADFATFGDPCHPREVGEP